MNLMEIIIIVFLYMNLGFLLSILLRRNDLADIFWGMGFVLIALVLFFKNFFGGNLSEYARGFLVLFLVSLWALRLSVYIGLRNRGKKEDWRYENWRKQWGKYFLIRSYFQVWILQGALILLIGFPIFIQMDSLSVPLNYLDYFGVLMWCIGFFFETVSDEQLRRFKLNKENKGKLMTKGLWKYSRHPNYFGEALLWWGLAVSSLHLPYGWISIASASILTFFLLKVSGVALLEKNMKEKPGFKEYVINTNAFIPWPPKNR